MSTGRWTAADLSGSADVVAPTLLGSLLISDSDDGRVSVRLTEVEAYADQSDPGSHAFRGRTRRNAVMFGPSGRAYVYFVYGMHWCLNVSCGPEGEAAAVLLRAGEVIQGRELAAARRPASRQPHYLASGPARLAAALGVTGAENGTDLLSPESPLRLEMQTWPTSTPVANGPRVGVGGAGADIPWRFWIEGERSVSAYRAHVKRPRSGTG